MLCLIKVFETQSLRSCPSLNLRTRHLISWSQVSQTWFAFEQSILAASNHLCDFLVAGNDFQEDFLHSFSGPKTKLFGLHFPGMEIAVMWFFLNIGHLPQYQWPFKDDREGPHNKNLMTFRCILSGPVDLYLSNWLQYSSPHLWETIS